jgi:NAD(P)-dependent dehydrogenase (short-subunit alcohol dehydrogenase family)
MERPVMIITGATRGMGAAAAEIAAQKGARVVLAATDGAALERKVQGIIERGGEAEAVAGDISQYAVCQKIIRRAVEAFGRIDALVNNAAIIGPVNAVADMSPEDFARTLEINLFGPVMLCHEAAPYLRETHGRVVNVSSGAGAFPIPGGSAYCSSKAALNHFSKIFSLEEPAITVVAVNPGSMDTDMMTAVREKGRGVKQFEDMHKMFVELHEQGRLIRPEDSALATVALALAAPPEITGKFVEFEGEEWQELIQQCKGKLGEGLVG